MVSPELASLPVHGPAELAAAAAGQDVRWWYLILNGSVLEAVRAPDGTTLTVEPLIRNRGRVMLKDFDPCTVLLNNDLSAGIPSVLENLHE